MAVDEVLLKWSAESGGCCWRFYRWQEATLSLGYFQQYDDRTPHTASRACPAVRRASGGGAILHDTELTYSFVVPNRHRLAARRHYLYEAVHTALVDVLADLGITASLCDEPVRPTARRQPFLCFQRRAMGDVLVGDTKIAGSAQRRLLGAVLQHGSVLLERSPAAPELDAMDTLARTPIREDRLIEAWLEALGRRLALRWQINPLSEQQRREATALVQDKYGAAGWTRHRGRQPARHAADTGRSDSRDEYL